MLFFGIFCAFMLRVNLSVGIVVMVRHNASVAEAAESAAAAACNPQTTSKISELSSNLTELQEVR
jgi:hypothetical protein